MSESQLLQNSDFRRGLERLLQAHLPQTFPALCICVIHRGQLRLHQAWGWLDPAARRLKTSTATRFDLASITKIFVETCFLILVDAGKVRLDDRLVDVIAEFGSLNPRQIGGAQDPHTRAHLPVDENFRGQSVDVNAVTFRHLLTHTAGLPPWRSVYAFASQEVPAAPQPSAGYDRERWRKALQAIISFPFVGTVGSTVRYTDIGLLLLGEAVARLHGCPLDRSLQELLLKPLALDTAAYNPILKGIPKEQIAPTEMDGSWRQRRVWGEVHDENACGAGGVAGHAGLFATAQDVARFGQAWLSGDSRLKIGSQLRRTATQQHAQGQYRMGLGWMLKSARDSSAGDLYSSRAYGHTGFTGTSLWIDPQRDLVSAVLTNRVYHGRDPDGIHAFRRAIHDLIVRGVDQQ